MRACHYIMDKTDFIKEHPDFLPEYMQRAIELSAESASSGGGPFGAVITRGGKIVGEGVNGVTRLNDPTAHAEVQAIRDACASLSTYSLAGCTVYSSCEPCPMCLSALYWAGVERIYFGNAKEDAAAIDFSDAYIYEELSLAREQRHLPCVHVPGTDAIRAFRLWQANPDKKKY